MQHYNDDEYDSYEEYSNEIDNSTAKKGKSGSKQQIYAAGSSYEAPTTANNSTALLYREQLSLGKGAGTSKNKPSLQKLEQSSPQLMQTSPQPVTIPGPSKASMMERFRTQKGTPNINNVSQSQPNQEFHLPTVVANKMPSTSQIPQLSKTSLENRQSLPELGLNKKKSPLIETTQQMSRNNAQMPPIVQKSLGLDNKKKQQLQNPDDMDIVRSSFQTLDNRNSQEQVKENSQPSHPSAANMLEKFRKKVPRESLDKPKSPSMTRRHGEVSKIQSSNSLVSKNNEAAFSHENQMSFVERIQNKRLKSRVVSRANSRRSQEEEPEEEQEDEQQEEEEEEDPEVVAQREEEARLAEEEEALVKEHEELRAQMSELNGQINDVLTELTGPPPAAEKPPFKNAMESARIQKQFLYQQKKELMKPQLGIQRMNSVRKDIKSKIATSLEASEDPEIKQKQQELFQKRLETYKADYDKLKQRLDSDGDTYTLETSLRKIDIEIRDQQRLNQQLNRNNLQMIKHQTQVYGVKHYRKTLDDESQIDLTIKQKRIQINTIKLSYEKTLEMIALLEETMQREKEQLQTHEEKIEELNFGLEILNEQQRIELPDNRSSSSVERVKPFSNENTQHLSKQEKLQQSIEKFQRDLQRLNRLKDVSVRSLTLEYNSLHHQHYQLHELITKTKQRQHELQTQVKDQNGFIERCSLWLQGKLIISNGIEDNNSIYTSEYTEMVNENNDTHNNQQSLQKSPSPTNQVNKSRLAIAREVSLKQLKKNELKEQMETLMEQLSPINKTEDNQPKLPLDQIPSPNLGVKMKERPPPLILDDDGAMIVRSEEELNQMPKVEQSASIRASQITKQTAGQGKPPHKISSSSGSRLKGVGKSVSKKQ